jgi:hypothetical protein
LDVRRNAMLSEKRNSPFQHISHACGVQEKTIINQSAAAFQHFWQICLKESGYLTRSCREESGRCLYWL